eukprot:TRINITY_DN10135_c0_g1_i1.p1 TRINITY_DN10135_c0_g1~~TRINITY_DN10135_c0_g1_i1.p1  ORF type:complete len:549 (-),score=100.19 TRINITY_DN10135_c0_g1_i1:26-1672(-)
MSTAPIEKQFITAENLFDDQKFKEAFQIYREIGDTHAGAMYKIALMYSNGLGIRQNDHKALRWLHLAAEHNNSKAQSTLGIMYYHNTLRGDPQENLVEGLRLLQIAAEAGEQEAIRVLSKHKPAAVTPENRKSPNYTKQDKLLVRAIGSYRGEQENDLNLEEGDIIKVLNKAEDPWWTGELNGKKGLFPSNYVEEISSPSEKITRDNSPVSTLPNSFSSSPSRVVVMPDIIQKPISLSEVSHKQRKRAHIATKSGVTSPTPTKDQPHVRLSIQIPKNDFSGKMKPLPSPVKDLVSKRLTTVLGVPARPFVFTKPDDKRYCLFEVSFGLDHPWSHHRTRELNPLPALPRKTQIQLMKPPSVTEVKQVQKSTSLSMSSLSSDSENSLEPPIDKKKMRKSASLATIHRIKQPQRLGQPQLPKHSSTTDLVVSEELLSKTSELPKVLPQVPKKPPNRPPKVAPKPPPKPAPSKIVPKTVENTSFTQWDPESVAKWLKSEGFDDQTTSIFLKEQVAGCDLSDITDEVLKSFGFQAFGQRNKLKKAIFQLTSSR